MSGIDYAANIDSTSSILEHYHRNLKTSLIIL